MFVLRHIAIRAIFGLTFLWGNLSLFAQQPEPPRLLSLAPLALNPGSESGMQLQGEGWGDKPFIWTSLAPSQQTPLAATSANAGTCLLTCPAETPVGLYGLRLVSSNGVSNLRLLLIDDLPTISADQGNRLPERAQPVALPVGVEGVCHSEASQYFSFKASAGQQISLEVYARRLASPLDPVVRILDQTGKELAYADDEPGLMGDCRLGFVAPAAGDYLIELRDIRYAGGKDYHYRFRLGNFPLASVCYPPVVQKGTTVEVVPCGTLTASLEPVRISIPTDYSGQDFKFGAKFPDQQVETHSDGSALLQVLASSQPQTLESEPNDKPTEASELKVAQGVSGRFLQHEDQDWYQFSAEAGERIALQAISKRFGSPAEVSLRIFNMEGKQIGHSNPASGAEPRLELTLPTAGQYQILAEDLNRRGGESYVYHLSLDKISHGFTLSVNESVVNPPEQGVFQLPVIADRTHYQGDITLELRDLPAGCELSNHIIPAGKNETTLQVQLPPEIPAGSFFRSKLRGHTAGSAVGSEEQGVAVSFSKPVRDELRWNVWPAADLTEQLAIGVGPAFPKFLKLTMQPTTVDLPQLVGTASITVKAERLHDFQEAVEIKLTGLPADVTTKATTIEKGQNEIKIQLAGGEKLPLGELPFEVAAQVTLQGQPQRVQLKGVLNVIPPLRLSLSIAGPLSPEGKQKLKIKVERLGKENHPVRVTLQNLPEGVTISEEIVIPVGVNTKEIELSVALTVKPGVYQNIQATSVTMLGEMEVTAHSQPVSLEIAKEMGASNGK